MEFTYIKQVSNWKLEADGHTW